MKGLVPINQSRQSMLLEYLSARLYRLFELSFNWQPNRFPRLEQLACRMTGLVSQKMR